MGKVFSSVIGTCNCSNLYDDISKEELTKIRMDISMIKENHLKHLERDVSEVKTDIKIINSNLQILLSRLKD